YARQETETDHNQLRSEDYNIELEDHRGQKVNRKNQAQRVRVKTQK
ncbi:hypothetical protein SOVF_057950, partial [Spinacia oleracea]